MPTNALSLPMPCDVFDGCSLNNPCYSRTATINDHQSPNEVLLADSHLLHKQLSFATNNELFEERSKDVRYEYCVEEFAKCNEVFMESEPFDDKIVRDLKWRLRLYPCLHIDGEKDHVGLFLRLDQCHRRKHVMASFRFSWMLDDDQVVKFMETPRPYLFYKNKDWGYVKFLPRDKVVEALTTQSDYEEEEEEEGGSDALRIICEIKIKSESEGPDLRKMGKYVYGYKNPDCSYKEPLLYIM